MKTGNKKLFIIAGAAAVLIIAAVIILLSSRGKNSETADMTTESTSSHAGEDTTAVKDTVSAGEAEGYSFRPDEYEQVWFFDTDDEYPEWEHARPYINPMGHEERYSYIEAEEKSYRVYDYADKSNTLVKREIYGDSWTLYVSFDENLTAEQNRQFVIDIEKYVEAMNGEIMGYYEDSIVFVLKDANDVRWWAEAAIDYEQIIISIVKQDELKVGQTLVINTADYEGNSARFASYNPGDEFQSFYLEYDGGEVSFDIYTDNSYGSYRRICRTRDTVYEGLGKGFYFDSIMYDPGLSNWEMSWYDSDETGEIRITLLKTGSIPQIKYGEPLGAIKVSAEHVSGIEAFPSGGNDMSIYHPEFSYNDFYLDKTPDGDHIMFVPAGLWDVKIYPIGDSLVNDYMTLMVPVNSGEVTAVEIPAGISNALKAEAAGYDERGIKIGAALEDIQKKQVSFTFTLLDRSTRDILPDRTNTRIVENGLSAELLSVERVKTPPDVVLLIDSSGSMRGQMQAAKIVEAFLKGAESTGSSVQSIYLAEYDISRCRGCHTCWSRGPLQCVIEDDTAKVIASLEGADIIIIASPVYFSNISGLLKDFIDRLTMVRSPHGPVVKDIRSGIPSLMMFASCGYHERREFEVISFWADRFAEKMGLVPAGNVFAVSGMRLASPSYGMLPGVSAYLALLEQAGRDAAENGRISPEMTTLLEQASGAYSV